MGGTSKVSPKIKQRIRHGLLFLVLGILILTACQSCAPAATPAGEASPSAAAEGPRQTPAAAEPTRTSPPAAGEPTQPSPAATPTSAPVAEGRLVELEWPEQVRLGESDLIRLALVPTRSGYVARAEFPDHTLQSKEVSVSRPDGYELYAIARLDGVGFEIAPTGDQERLVPVEEEVAWRWTLAPRQAGQQRLSVQLRLRWVPAPGTPGGQRESQIFARGLDVRVASFLGLSQGQAAVSGVIGMLLGTGCLLAALLGANPGVRRASSSPTTRTEHAQSLAPNPNLTIETPPTLAISAEEDDLLRALFQKYARVVIENEFLSGYSGARTFLVRPIRPDDCADALTIVKLGPQPAIQAEFSNYETFVKDRLPPVTARIQRPPVVAAARSNGKHSLTAARAAVQYTFIAEPGRPPVSLRRALLENPDPGLLTRLFETFGPHWWMQRRPYTFRLEQEYDALLPPHYVIEPLDGVCAPVRQPAVGEKDRPAQLRLAVGDLVFARAFRRMEMRTDGRSLTLWGQADGSGQPALRLRWLSPYPPDGTAARVVATRGDLLGSVIAGFDPSGLPEDLTDPLSFLPGALQETVTGTRSVIHGDLNLENVLVGPGSLVWLIDFAQTREGHPLFDFAHLESELIAHVLAPRCGSPAVYLSLWRDGDPLLETLHALAARCLFDPGRPREYFLALYLSCLGALKYQNLSPLSKHCLYLTASELVRSKLDTSS